MADKIKVLFITTDFYQAGTERFMYEIDNAIDKNKFDINILSLLPLNNSNKWKDYYYEKHFALGSKIYFLNEIQNSQTPTIKQRIRRKIRGGSLPDPKTNIQDFIQKFEALSFWGEYSYPELDRILTPEQKKKCLIHIMNSKYQNKNLYMRFDKKQFYHFVSGFREEEIKFELSEFKDFTHTFLPLSINIDKSLCRWQFSDKPEKKIGIFTRLTSHKPLDPFIYSFHLLLNEFPSAELHIYGTGDPKEEGMYAYVNHLRLEDKVKFRGHQDNIIETALNDKLNLIWFHGYHGVPGGFAGFDICTTGIPQVFWNFGAVESKDKDEVLPMYCDLKGFVEKNSDQLTNRTSAKELSQKQYNYILEHRDVLKFIPILEDLYCKVAEKKD